MSSPYSPTSSGLEYNEFADPWRTSKWPPGIIGPRTPPPRTFSPPSRLMNPSPPPHVMAEPFNRGPFSSGVAKGRRSPSLPTRITKPKEPPTMCRRKGKPRTPPYPESSQFRPHSWSPGFTKPREPPPLSPRIIRNRRSPPMSPGIRIPREQPPLSPGITKTWRSPSLPPGIRKPREPPPLSPRVTKSRRSPPLSPGITKTRRTPPMSYGNMSPPPIPSGFSEPLIPLVLPPRPNRHRQSSPENQPPSKIKIRSPPPPTPRPNKPPSPSPLPHRNKISIPSPPPPPRPVIPPLSTSTFNKPQPPPVINSQTPMFYSVFGPTPSESGPYKPIEEHKPDKKKKKMMKDRKKKENKNIQSTTHELTNNSVEDSTAMKRRFLDETDKQKTVEKVVKQVLKPHFFNEEISKKDYTEILKRSVIKICRATTDRISLNKVKIEKFVEAYVQTFKLRNLYKELENRIKVPNSPSKNVRNIGKNGDGVTLNIVNSYLPVCD